MSKHDGGSAFPRSAMFDANGDLRNDDAEGMSLRTYAAIKFGVALIARLTRDEANEKFGLDARTIRRMVAREAIAQADELLAQLGLI